MRFFLPSLFSSISIEPGLTINFEIFALMTAAVCYLNSRRAPLTRPLIYHCHATLQGALDPP